MRPFRLLSTTTRSLLLSTPTFVSNSQRPRHSCVEDIVIRVFGGFRFGRPTNPRRSRQFPTVPEVHSQGTAVIHMWLGGRARSSTAMTLAPTGDHRRPYYLRHQDGVGSCGFCELKQLAFILAGTGSFVHSVITFPMSFLK